MHVCVCVSLCLLPKKTQTDRVKQRLNDAAVEAFSLQLWWGWCGGGGHPAEHHTLSPPPQREDIRGQGERLHLAAGAVSSAEPLKCFPQVGFGKVPVFSAAKSPPTFISKVR